MKKPPSDFLSVGGPGTDGAGAASARLGYGAGVSSKAYPPLPPSKPPHRCAIVFLIYLTQAKQEIREHLFEVRERGAHERNYLQEISFEYRDVPV